MDPQRQFGTYIGFDSSSIVHYLESSIGNVSRARFIDCHLDKNKFSTLISDDPHLLSPLEWYTLVSKRTLRLVRERGKFKGSCTLIV